MSTIGDNPMMVPGVQASDIGDNEIINGTRMAQVGPDAFELSFTMPSGRELKSAPFNSDFRRKAMLAWVDAVRQNIVADSQEVAAQARRGLLAPPIDPDAPAAAEVVAAPDARSGSPGPGTVGHEQLAPAALIGAQLEAAERALNAAVIDYEVALEKKTAAEAAVYQWRKLWAVVSSSSLPGQPQPPATGHGTSPLDALGSAARGRRKRDRAHPPTPSVPSQTLTQPSKEAIGI